MSNTSTLQFLCHVAQGTVPLLCSRFSPKSPQQTPHNSSVRARYGVCFVSCKSDSCSAALVAVLFKMPWYIRGSHNGTLLYIMIIHAEYQKWQWHNDPFDETKSVLLMIWIPYRQWQTQHQYIDGLVQRRPNSSTLTHRYGNRNNSNDYGKGEIDPSTFVTSPHLPFLDSEWFVFICYCNLSEAVRAPLGIWRVPAETS